MLSWLISSSIRMRPLVLAMCVVLLVVGYRSIQKAPLDVFPEFAPPIIEIQTEAPGLTTDEVESHVSVPLENALNGTPYVKTIRSKSVLGLSQVVLVLETGTDPLKVRQLVQERVAAEARMLPANARPPVILQPLSTLSRVLKIGIRSDTLDQRKMTELALWTIRPKLMSIPGVANVAIWGQRDTQFQVLVDPNRLRANNVTLEMFLKAVGDRASLEAGGWIDTPNQRFAIRPKSPIVTPEDLGNAVIDRGDNSRLLVKDVATIVIDSPPPIGDAIINNVPGLLLIVEKQPQANTLEVTRAVEKALVDLKPGLQEVTIDPTIFRPATFIERALDNLTRSLLIGCGLVVVILIIFLYDWRTAVISLTAIPLSLTAALLALTWAGATINTMVLAGLVIALGEVVDDAIIDVENIRRRLRQRQDSRSAIQVVLDASLEVRSSVVYASLIVVLVFVPVFFLDGLAGSFFRPLALAYVIAIMASLLVALTVTPALASILLVGRKHDRPEAPLATWLKQGYQQILPAFIARPYLALATLVIAFTLTAGAAYRLGQDFLPNFQETDFLMHFVEKPGTSIAANTRATTAASKRLMNIDGVRNFGSHIGRAEVADEVVGPNFTEFWISIKEDVDYPSTIKKVEDVVYSYPGVYRDLLTYLRERIKEVLTGTSGTIVVRLFGPEVDGLRAKAKEIERAMATVPGVVNLKVEPQVMVAQIEIDLKPESAKIYRLTAAHIRRATTVLLKGAKVGEVFDRQRKTDIVVWCVPEKRKDLSALHNLIIDTPTGMQVRLGDVATVSITSAPNEIKRENASRRLDITCNVAKDRDLGSVAREIEEKVKAIPFDREQHPEFLGEYTARRESTNRLFLLGSFALIGIVLLLYVDFQSWRPTLLVALTIPFALIGGVAGVILSNGTLSLGSIVGFVTVLGIAARNGIMMVSHFRHLELEEGEPFGISLIMRGAAERLAPILMTALATGLALLPLVIAGNKPGHEIEYPLAVVILGGLVTSTILNLFLLPPLYAKFGRSAGPEH